MPDGIMTSEHPATTEGTRSQEKVSGTHALMLTLAHAYAPIQTHVSLFITIT